MDNVWAELFQYRPRWQGQALQHIVDVGQEVMFGAVEQAFNALWTTLAPQRTARGFMAYLNSLVPEAMSSMYGITAALTQWAEVWMAERLEVFQAQLTTALQDIARKSATMLGEEAQKQAGKWVPLEVRTTFRFDQTNREALDWATRRSAGLVTGVDNTMRRNIQMLVANSVAGRATPQQLARQLYDFIPLLPSHTAALLKQEASLVAQGVPRKKAQEQLQDTARRYRRYRANNIARTETITANNYGVNAYFAQKQEKGYLPGSAVRVWIATRDDRTCPRCVPMHGKTSPIDGVWKGPGPKAGTESILSFPPLHPSCRCTLALWVPTLHTAQEAEEMWAPILR